MYSSRCVLLLFGFCVSARRDEASDDFLAQTEGEASLLYLFKGPLLENHHKKILLQKDKSNHVKGKDKAPFNDVKSAPVERAPNWMRWLPVGFLLGWGGVLISEHLEARRSQGWSWSSMSNKQWKAIVVTTIVLVTYFLSGSALILLNNEIMNTFSFPYPTTVASMGVYGTVLLTQSLYLSGCATPRSGMTWSDFFWRIVPVSVFTAAALSLGNSVYLYLPVPFIQVMKVLSPVYTLILAIACRLKKADPRLVISVVVIVLGGILSSVSVVMQAVELSSFTGFLIMFFASLTESWRVVSTEVLLKKVEMPFFDSLLWSSPITAVLLLAIGGMIEFPDMQKNVEWTSELVFWLGLSLILGLLNTVSTFKLVELLGSLTLKVLVQGRNLTVIILAISVLGEYCSIWEFTGYTVSLFGLALYDYTVRVKPSKAHEKMEDDDERKPLMDDVKTAKE